MTVPLYPPPLFNPKKSFFFYSRSSRTSRDLLQSPPPHSAPQPEGQFAQIFNYDLEEPTNIFFPEEKKRDGKKGVEKKNAKEVTE